jgi:hypothetical protein
VVGACTLAGHPVAAVAATRRFWACGGCLSREATVTPNRASSSSGSSSSGGGAVRPPKPCRKCAEKGTRGAVWKRCGAGHASAAAPERSEGLLLSVSEGTSYRDAWGSGLDAVSDKH